jgi:Sensors of blue-light using FAD
MFSLVYVSSATNPFSDAQLRGLLEQSRVANQARDITGVLLYKGGNFMQLLDGEESAVRNLYRKISLDTRHQGSMILLAANESQRLSSDWSMAFRALKDPQLATMPGYSDFLNIELTDSRYASEPSRTQRLLHYLRDSMR